MPTETDARLEPARAAARGGDSSKARALIEAQISVFPDDPSLLRASGDILRQCDDHAAALKLFQRALAISTTEIAALHAALGETDEALRCYVRAVETCPTYPAAYLSAARFARDHGKSWQALLILQRLYEQLPGHVEGNRLRGEFLRYHATHPEVARSFETIGQQAHFRHLRALTEVGDYAGVVAHTRHLTAPAGSELAYHAAMFSGHAKLALAIDSAGLVTRATALEQSSAWLAANRLSERLRDAIRRRSPLSMIRLGDGEARFLTLSDSWARDRVSAHEATCIVDVIWRNWFGQPIDTATDLDGLNKLFTDALAGADIIGVSPAQRYERDMFHRGYLALLDHAVDRVLAVRNDVALTHAFANTMLHQRSPFYGELLSGLDFLGCVSPHPGLAHRLTRHHGIETVCEYLVPGEARLPEPAHGRGAHYPDRFREIMASLHVPRPGAVFLVAAGLLGKIYCHRIRELGRIAIDAGSIVDAWMGFATRPGLYTDPGAWVLPITETTA